MPQTPHVERHITAGETVRDIVIGMSDGLTMPFALAAGALQGRDRCREEREVVEKAEAERAEVDSILGDYGIPQRSGWASWMRFEFGLEKPDPKRALTRALMIAGACIAGE